MTRFSRTALSLAFAFSLAPFTQAAEPAAAKLPAARSLIDAHVAAIGGRDALLTNVDGSLKSTMQIVEAGMKGDLLIYSSGEDRLMTITLPGVGETKMGRTGDLLWSMDAMNGPRVLEGKERQQLNEQLDPLYAIRDASLVETATTTGLSDSEGRACYRVEIKWKTGSNSADCYSSENGLLLSTESTASTPMGELKQVSHLSEYTLYGKTKAAKITKTKVAGMTQLVSIESFEAAPQDPKLFVLPAAIEALAKKAANSTETNAGSQR